MENRLANQQLLDYIQRHSVWSRLRATPGSGVRLRLFSRTLRLYQPIKAKIAYPLIHGLHEMGDHLRPRMITGVA
jgi:hypothetical protein